MFVHPLHYYPCITFPPFWPNLHIVIRLVGSSRTFMGGKYHYAWQTRDNTVNLCNEVPNRRREEPSILQINTNKFPAHLRNELGVNIREAPRPGLGSGPRALRGRGPVRPLDQGHPPDHRPETGTELENSRMKEREIWGVLAGNFDTIQDKVLNITDRYIRKLSKPIMPR